jgi:hypothetical protein
MAKVTGIIKVKLDALIARSLPGAKLDPGGVMRKPSKGWAVYGYAEAVKESELTCEFVHAQGDDITQYDQLTASTVEFICDTGQTYMIAGMWMAEPATITQNDDGAKVSIKMNGPPAVLVPA